MTDVTIEAGTLTANREDRVVSGLLLPYGEIGRSNLGRFSVDRGVFEIPADHSVLNANLDHKRENPVARVMTLNDTEAGLFAAFRVAEGPDGDTLLAEAEKRTGRCKLSVEATGVVIRAGKAVAGRVFGAAFVKEGAFPSATLLAADAGDLPEEFPDYLKPTESTSESTEEIVINGVTYVVKNTSQHKTEVEQKSTTEDDPAVEPEEEEAVVPETLNATAPAGGIASRRSTAAPNDVEPQTLFAALAQMHRTGDRAALDAVLEAGNPNNLFAALSDIKISGSSQVGTALTQPAWVGKFWAGEPHQRVIVPQLGSKDLTALTVEGWEWTTKPKVGRWTGNKTDVPSNAPAATKRPISAQRFAGAHDIAREFTDFPNPEFWEAYFEAMRESYAIDTDAYALEQLVAGATAVTIGTVPTDVPEVLVKLIDGALAVNKKGVPTFAVLAEDEFREFALAPKDHVLELLSASLPSLSEGSLANFKVIPTPYDQTGAPVLDPGQVLVGTKAAATWRELPGSPIRVEGLDMVKGGVDPGLFGYGLLQIDSAAGLALIEDEEA